MSSGIFETEQSPARWLGGWLSGSLRALVGAVMLLGLCLVSGCEKSELFTWKQTLTVTVDTPKGPVSASAVQNVQARFYTRPPLGTSTRVQKVLEGDPVLLDLGDVQVLIAIQSSHFVDMLYNDQQGRYHMYQAFTQKPSVPPRSADVSNELTKQNLHLLRFRDPSDPATIDWVNPEDMATTFGPGFALKEVRMEVTGIDLPEPFGRVYKPLSGEIVKLLPWLNTREEVLFIARPNQPDLSLQPDDLKTGVIR